MIAPPPFKLKCPNCGYKKIVQLKSDAITDPTVLSNICPKCRSEMETKPLNTIEKLLLPLFR